MSIYNFLVLSFVLIFVDAVCVLVSNAMCAWSYVPQRVRYTVNWVLGGMYICALALVWHYSSLHELRTEFTELRHENIFTEIVATIVVYYTLLRPVFAMFIAIGFYIWPAEYARPGSPRSTRQVREERRSSRRHAHTIGVAERVIGTPDVRRPPLDQLVFGPSPDRSSVFGFPTISEHADPTKVPDYIHEGGVVTIVPTLTGSALADYTDAADFLPTQARSPEQDAQQIADDIHGQLQETPDWTERKDSSEAFNDAVRQFVSSDQEPDLGPRPDWDEYFQPQNGDAMPDDTTPDPESIEVATDQPATAEPAVDNSRSDTAEIPVSNQEPEPDWSARFHEFVETQQGLFDEFVTDTFEKLRPREEVAS